MSVGDMIKRRRYELRMSQQELADAMGYKTRFGYVINFVESSINNIKITREEDIAAFSTLAKAMQI